MRRRLSPVRGGAPRDVASHEPVTRLRAITRSGGHRNLSPAAQAAKIEAVAALQGLDLIETITDKESAKEGSVKRRPGMVDT